MSKLKFLIFGKNKEILEVLNRLVNSNEDWHGVAFSDDEQAKDYVLQNTLDMVLLSSGIDTSCEDKMCSFFLNQQPNIEIIQHYGGGSGLLKCEIMEALEKRRLRNEAQV
ncbi:hypothetical protein [Flavobacterium sp.]|uniref:hypothetical protein n=1 Tax=Flavobacterium sp. TaxID=239 RepID=UPI002B4B4209|nr:hypothetical protein [Flavobacterium sp.]HLP64683.1 hypothetical protein [Flavobacterium sp.]